MNDSSSYTPPGVWSCDSGGRFASIDRPSAGAPHDKAPPVDCHPLQPYSLAAPNGVKVLRCPAATLDAVLPRSGAERGTGSMRARLGAVLLAMMSWNIAQAAPPEAADFYPKTTAQQERLMEAFQKNFSDYDFEKGRVARPFRFEGRSRWHVNASLYKRCMNPGILDSKSCTRHATIPNPKGKVSAPKGFEDEFSISVNSKEFFYSCGARLFVGNEDPELIANLLGEAQDVDPSVTKAPFVFVDCSCEPISPDHEFSDRHATGCDSFGYSTDAAGN